MRIPVIVVASALLLAPIARAQEAGGPGEPGGEGVAAALEGDPSFELGARLGALWAMDDAPGAPIHEFALSHSRLELSWEQWKIVKAELSVEAGELLEGEGAGDLLRDLWIRVRPLEWLGVRLGQFKKPFSGNELGPRGKYPLIDRGLSNRYLVEHLRYGDRDIGLMLEGRLVPAIKLDYALGVFNGLGRNAPELSADGSVDLAARLEARPAKWLSLGANGSIKLIDGGDLTAFVDEDDYALVDEDAYPAGYGDADLVREHGWMTGPAWAAGADAALKAGGLRVAAEGMLGENWWFEKYPLAWSALLMASYKWRLGDDLPLWLEPALRGEVLVLLTSTSEWRARMWQVAPALNLHIGGHVRLMIDGEFVFTEGTEADLDGSRREGLWPNEWPGDFAGSKRLMLQLVFEV